MLKIHLRRSKCDQFGKLQIVGQSGNELCPVDAFVAYMGVRAVANFSVIKTAIHRFICEMRKALSAVGLQLDQYAGHSSE